MLQLASRAQVAMWGLRSRAASTLRNEKGEANVFAVIIGILLVAIVLGGIAFFAISAGSGITEKAQSCLENPQASNCSGGITTDR